ncbi:low-specificity D-threonine aldolase [Arcticibacter svalbardensis MN12-7]|uniref:Low-specificity D-threonine aldolase n=1 Tax=Arcticibacter svalbardensis MN12-7 TaxID=1150600 RepID=R9GS26_9SPHI|nr:alanine racemase [Arcticibacter svalbardensis]EOR94360.1 low-specificity D-threonine aldolase [Arcticibacter svalbardensis MN12-7]
MKTNQNDNFKIVNAENIISPQLVVFADIVKRNVQHLIDLFEHSGQLRPHVKTNKCPQVVQIMMDAGIHKFKCATISEAEMLALIDAPDVLLAYQPVGPNIARFVNLVSEYPKTLFSCLIDNIKTADQIDLAAQNQGAKINIFIDLNVGMNRTGLSDKHQIFSLFKHCETLNSITVAGLHAYDGHLVDENEPLRLEKASKCFAYVKKSDRRARSSRF